MEILKESIKPKVNLLEPKSLDKDFDVVRRFKSKIWILKVFSLTPTWSEMFYLLTSLNS